MRESGLPYPVERDHIVFVKYLVAAGDRAIVVAVCGRGALYSGVRVASTHTMRGHEAMSLGGCRLRD